MQRIRPALIALFAAFLVFGQDSPAHIEFEVASVRPAAEKTPGQNIGVHIDGAQVRCTSLSLKDYIGMAYRMKYYQISGPDWLATEKFDIAAKLPDGSSGERIPEMLQTLLAERFELKLHRDSKDYPVYLLETAKNGPKLKESDPDQGPDSGGAGRGGVNIAASGAESGVGVNLGGGSYLTFGNNRLEGKKLTMPTLADTLGRFMDRPVVDGTDLKSKYDLILEFSQEDYQAMMIHSAVNAGVVLPPAALRYAETVSGASIASALQKVGLVLNPRKVPLDTIVIDHVLKSPADN